MPRQIPINPTSRSLVSGHSYAQQQQHQPARFSGGRSRAWRSDTISAWAGPAYSISTQIMPVVTQRPQPDLPPSYPNPGPPDGLITEKGHKFPIWYNPPGIVDKDMSSHAQAEYDRIRRQIINVNRRWRVNLDHYIPKAVFWFLKARPCELQITLIQNSLVTGPFLSFYPG